MMEVQLITQLVKSLQHNISIWGNDESAGISNPGQDITHEIMESYIAAVEYPGDKGFPKGVATTPQQTASHQEAMGNDEYIKPLGKDDVTDSKGNLYKLDIIGKNSKNELKRVNVSKSSNYTLTNKDYEKSLEKALKDFLK